MSSWLPQRRFHLAALYPVAADLDLPVRAAGELDPPGRPPSADVAGPVQACAGPSAERVGDEPATVVRAAWPVSQGHGVTVAVIDSGVNPQVSDLAGSVTTGPDYSGVSTPSSNPEWGMHGTWMASLIVGHGHGFESGVSGVAPKARVLSIRVLPDRKVPGL